MFINHEAIRRGYELKAGILPAPPPPRTVDHAQIRAITTQSARLRAICEAMDWDMALILEQSRRIPVVQARTAAIRLWAEIFPEHSLQQIGKVFGLNHHTSVLHALGRTTRARAKAKANDTSHH